jgi:uncharacterized protein
MNNNLKKILNIMHIAKKIDGRKKFQKIVYILKQNGLQLTENFIYHYFGPYSPELQLEIEYLVIKNLIDEGVFDHSVNYLSYTYKIKEFSEEDINNEVLNYKDLIMFLNKKSPSLLEVLATIYYLVDNGYHDRKKLERKIQILKPDLSEHFDEAYKIYLSQKN